MISLILMILLTSLSNCAAGRIEDLLGTLKYKRLYVAFLRCVFPGAIAGILTHSYYAWLAVTAGSALWFPFNWSFCEITGIEDTKYQAWVRSIGYWLFPTDVSASTNRKRGIVMKGIRGSYDILTFILLTAINPEAMIYWLGTFTMGLVYWLCGKILPDKYAVLAGELSYGAVRGVLIGLALSI